MAKPLLGRALAVGAVAVVLLLPIFLIEGKIDERRALAESVVTQFASETTGRQVIAGPLIALTCEESYVEERQVMRAGKAETVSEKKTRACPTGYFTPRALTVVANIPVENLHRGIYPLRLYRASIEMTGGFTWPAPPTGGTQARAWKGAYMVFSVSDPRGIKSVASATSGELSKSGAALGEREFAITESLGDFSARKPGEVVPFTYRLQVAGTSSIHLMPVGDATEIRLVSDWPHPSFTGAWSPDERRITPRGFEAFWRTTHIATGGQAFWQKAALEGKLQAPGLAAGVSFFDPINVYSLSYRATQYGFLFILFTFGALALVEALAAIRLHVIQYALVGSAIAVFFLLLIALSEHIAFDRAYVIAAAACVCLLTIYLRHPLASMPGTAAFFALFAFLYASLYGLLLSEDHALLLGSLMVFLLLATVMLATRKLDWNTASARMIGSSAKAA